MPGLTSKEASGIEEGLHLEETMIAKLGSYANQVTDPECRRILLDVQAMHQRHYSILRRQVDTAVAYETSSWSGENETTGTGTYQSPTTGF